MIRRTALTRPHQSFTVAVRSMDSSLRSNISVGPPIDLLTIAGDALRTATRQSLAENYPYFAEVRTAWGTGLRGVQLDQESAVENGVTVRIC